MSNNTWNSQSANTLQKKLNLNLKNSSLANISIKSELSTPQQNSKMNTNSRNLCNDGIEYFYYSIEEINDLKCLIISQTNTIKEYESWVNLLISIINSNTNNSNHHDFGSLLQKVKFQF